MRTQKAFKNVLTSIGSYLLVVVLGLIVRRLLLHRFDTELVGYDSLLSNIFALISVADLGLRGVSVFRMYQAFAKDDHDQISKLLSIYRKLYLSMGAVVGLICLVLFFFLPAIFSGKVNFWGYFRLMYILYSITAISSYLFDYWQIPLNAGQLEYKCTQISTVTQVANSISRALVLWTVRSYLLYLILNTTFDLISHIWNCLTAKKEFPYIKPVSVSWAELRAEGFTDEIHNALPIKLAGAINKATDSLLITMLIDAATTGLYSNYLLIGSGVVSGFTRILYPLRASVADLVYKESKDDALNLYKTIELLCFFLATMIFSGFTMVFQNAIAVFFGARYWLPMSFVLAYAVLGYVSIQSVTDRIFRGCFGEYHIERRFSVTGAVINLAVSVVLLQVWNVTGVLIGTIIADIFVWHGQMAIVEKKLFGRSFRKLWGAEAVYFLLACAEVALTWLLLRKVPYSFWNMWIRCFGSVLIPTACNVVIFWRTPGFQNILLHVKMILAKFGGNKQ